MCIYTCVVWSQGTLKSFSTLFMLWHCCLIHVIINCNLIPYVGKFWSGKNWQIWRIECRSPIFYLPITSFVISCSYTCSSFDNILSLQYLPMYSIIACLKYMVNSQESIHLCNVYCIDHTMQKKLMKYTRGFMTHSPVGIQENII